MGSLKEAAGNLIGNESLKQGGREQNERGQGQEAKGQLTDLGQGVGDRVSGAVGGAFAGLTGDRAGQEKYANQHVSSSRNSCLRTQLISDKRTKERLDNVVWRLNLRSLHRLLRSTIKHEILDLSCIPGLPGEEGEAWCDRTIVVTQH